MTSVPDPSDDHQPRQSAGSGGEDINARRGLDLAPFRALRYRVGSNRLGDLLCPPYDVIGAAERQTLIDGDPDNAVSLILPRTQAPADPYDMAAQTLQRWRDSGLLGVDERPGLYVYDMTTSDGAATRGLVGAVELRDPADGVILPHENTMAGPVADRLALMKATQANLEPIYLVYDGGGDATRAVHDVAGEPLASATTADATSHRLWSLTDPDQLAAVRSDLNSRRALIADGHHRYATYRELQRIETERRGHGPWDRGLALLVDTSQYGPQVHAIHRVLIGLALERAQALAATSAEVVGVDDAEKALATLADDPAFAVVLTDGDRAYVVRRPDRALIGSTRASGEPEALAELDVTVLHRVLVPLVWGLSDDVETVDYAHSVDEAVARARSSQGTAVLMRPTPVQAVAAVAAAGARMPRKSTLFTPKPASGLLMRRFADQ